MRRGALERCSLGSGWGGGWATEFCLLSAVFDVILFVFRRGDGLRGFSGGGTFGPDLTAEGQCSCSGFRADFQIDYVDLKDVMPLEKN